MDEPYELLLLELSREVVARPGALTHRRARAGRLIGMASNPPVIVDRCWRPAFPHFDHTISRHESPHPKPAPDIYLAWLPPCVDPAACVALEDSPTGVRSARAAGMFVIGIPSLEGIALDADLVARSLDDAAVRARLGL